MDFLTSIEGIGCILVSLFLLAGGISEYVYFNNTCKRTIKGYEDLGKEIESWKN